MEEHLFRGGLDLWRHFAHSGVASAAVANSLQIYALSLLAVLGERGYGALQLLILYLACSVVLAVGAEVQTRLGLVCDADPSALDDSAVDDCFSDEGSSDDLESACKRESSSESAHAGACDPPGDRALPAAWTRRSSRRASHARRRQQADASRRGSLPAAMALTCSVCAATLMPLPEVAAISLLTLALARLAGALGTPKQTAKSKRRGSNVDVVCVASTTFALAAIVALLVVPRQGRARTVDRLDSVAKQRRARVKHVVAVAFAVAAAAAAAVQRVRAARRRDVDGACTLEKSAGGSPRSAKSRLVTAAVLLFSRFPLPSPLRVFETSGDVFLSPYTAQELAIVTWAALAGIALVPLSRPLGLGASPPEWFADGTEDVYATSASLLAPDPGSGGIGFVAVILVAISAASAHFGRGLAAAFASRVAAPRLAAISMLRVPLSWILSWAFGISTVSLRSVIAGLAAVVSAATLSLYALDEPADAVEGLNDPVPLLELRQESVRASSSLSSSFSTVRASSRKLRRASAGLSIEVPSSTETSQVSSGTASTASSCTPVSVLTATGPRKTLLEKAPSGYPEAPERRSAAGHL